MSPSPLASAELGSGRRLHIVGCTKVEVTLKSGHYECSRKVKNNDGSWSRGYTLATLRTLLDTAGIVSEAVVAPIQDHDLEVCRSMLTSAPALRAGDLLLEDNGEAASSEARPGRVYGLLRKWQFGQATSGLDLPYYRRPTR